MPFPITKEWLIANYLFGLDLTNDKGVEYPDSLYEHAILSAKDWAKRALDLELDEREVTERHDWDINQWSSYIWLQVRRKPLQRVTALAFMYGNHRIMQAHPDWIVEIIPEAGQFQVMPVSGAVQSTPVVGIVPWLMPNFASRATPGFYEVKYTAGFEEIPADILHLIAMQASMNVLNPAGDMIAGAGVAAKAVSIDGLSTSISTTSSATNAGYGARIIQYQKDMKRLIPTIRNYYHGFRMGVA